MLIKTVATWAITQGNCEVTRRLDSVNIVLLSCLNPYDFIINLVQMSSPG